ncbi:probable indole-3-pyruvate monooxygenase YUCCA3 isoform X1 [Rosa chinensis]|uniref:probable indole-3-pyruvate monooxygenase YUCCA3 isoform X1 n=1 Tax=Rosa chinensis TaxID=74649 RepID=UPI000D097057|nr:probable indole-3-pyruvate monooxygenase YUCCA3 isoform X1 [Rosa chinensis]
MEVSNFNQFLKKAQKLQATTWTTVNGRFIYLRIGGCIKSRLALGIPAWKLLWIWQTMVQRLQSLFKARPKEGPFFMKINSSKYPTIDVGTCSKIKSGEIQVLPAEIGSIRGSDVELKKGKSYQFESIVFCTGFKTSTSLWLKADDYLLKEDGIPRPSSPNHSKGQKGLYCVGLSRSNFPFLYVLWSFCEDAYFLRHLNHLFVKFGAKICLITSLRDTCYIEILPEDRNPTQELWLSFWSEVHYNSLYATADVSTRSPRKNHRLF